MNALDFLSGPPQISIFEKNSNKTNLGGVLTLIYLIIILIISIAYIYDYEVNPKYIVSYSYEHKYVEDDDKRFFHQFNPNLTFNFDLAGPPINESELLILSKDKKLSFNKIYNALLSNFGFELYYICQDNDKECNPNKLELSRHELHMNYSGYKLEHQNDESPIIRFYRTEFYPIGFGGHVSYYILRWKTIIYKEEKGISGIFDKLLHKNNDIYGVEFIDPLNGFIKEDNVNNKEYEDVDGTTIEKRVRLLSKIYLNPNFPYEYYDYYSRKKIEISDPIANICSLANTLYSIFKIVFCIFYSNSFDNYKIIEKIISKKYNKSDTEKKINKKELIDIINDDENEENEKDDKLIELNNFNNIKQKEDNLLDKNYNIREEKKKDFKDIENEDERILPKLHFYHYFFNILFCKNKCMSNNQEIISACNEIISKYYSIDNILYNQLLLENLFKDYKWNDSKLNNIENNKLVNDLNLLINN